MTENATQATREQMGSSPSASVRSPELVGSMSADPSGSPRTGQQEPKTTTANLQDKHGANTGSWVWQLATLVVPVLLTGWLTYMSSQTEVKIKKDIDDKSQMLSEKLQLTEELYKRRFDAYEKLFTQLKVLQAKLRLENLKTTRDSAHLSAQAEHHLAASNRQTADLLAQLDELREMNELHMSPDVEKLMSDAWLLEVRGDPEAVASKISEVEKQMKAELEKQMVGEKETQPASNKTGKPGKSS